MVPSLGRIVHLRLSAQCAEEINRRRGHARSTGLGAAKTGVIVHAGNPVKEGEEFPLLITRVWADADTVHEGTAVNGQVFLDGNDVLWVCSVVEGENPGQWHEPSAEGATTRL